MTVSAGSAPSINPLEWNLCCGGYHLTGRQLDVVVLLAAGQGTGQISDALHISTHTVTHHIGRMLDQFGVENRTELVSRAYFLGVLDPHFWPPRVTDRRCSRLDGRLTDEQPAVHPGSETRVQN